MEQFIPKGLEAVPVGTLSQQNIKEIKNLTLEEIIAKINAGDIAEPVKYTLALDTLTTDKQIDISGNFFGVIDASAANAKITVKFNRNQSEGIDFTKGLYMTRPYNKVFISWAAQTGATIQIIIASFNKDLFEIQDFRTEASAATDTAAIKNNTRLLNGDTGTQVVKSNIAVNQTTLIHTVTAGKNLYISSCGANQGYTGGMKSTLFITDASDNLVAELINLQYSLGTQSQCFVNPVKVPAGYKIKISSNVAGQGAAAFFQGWEE